MTETGKPIPEVAEDLGIHPETLHSWVSRARRNGSPSSDQPVAEPSLGVDTGGLAYSSLASFPHNPPCR
ncbi:transposase [Streptomyces sp. MA5143a]|uniref:transposase n=1 Tax=Streptomyces sp. MA5143a TaxID=2083010 RepID=UPI00215944D8|nr:transposase [Streptomyces sp. MA5143a]